MVKLVILENSERHDEGVCVTETKGLAETAASTELLLTRRPLALYLTCSPLWSASCALEARWVLQEGWPVSQSVQ
jgi:hypothetical protein